MRVLVTGGGGFLGGAICTQLRARGDTVGSLARGDYPRLAALGVHQHRVDLGDADGVRRACTDYEAVIHTAAKAGAWGPYAEYERANVLGTRNVLAACRALGIRRLVYTSTPSVTHRAGHPLAGAAQAPYGDPFRAAYPATKAIAEREALSANDANLATVALRPRLIWGPGDPHLLPGLLARARSGRLRLVGHGRCKVDTTYIDNAASAHLAALDHLHPGAACAGKAYFISNGEPRPLAQIINALLAAADVPPVRASVPYPLAYAIGAVSELAWRLLPLAGEPPLTRFLAEQLATEHWYDITPAACDFGWRPQVGLDAGFARLRAALAATMAG